MAEIFKLGYPAPSNYVYNGANQNVYGASGSIMYISNYLIISQGSQTITISN